MIEPKIVVDEKADPDLRAAIVGLLQDYNWSKVDKPTVEPFAISIRHPENDAVIGGLWGASFGGWFLVEVLYVPGELRQRAIGTSMMKQAEEAAIKRGCVGVWLDTFTFQAPGFYEKLGYERMGKLTDFPKGHERIFYFKRFDR